MTCQLLVCAVPLRFHDDTQDTICPACRERVRGLDKLVPRVVEPDIKDGFLSAEYEQKRRHLFEMACIEEGDRLRAKLAQAEELRAAMEAVLRDFPLGVYVKQGMLYNERWIREWLKKRDAALGANSGNRIKTVNG